MKQSVLHMTLHRRWFDQIAAGTKTEEYREIKEYWTKRLNRNYDVIIFKNGYSKGCPEMCVEYRGYEEKTIWHPIHKRRERVYALKLGRIKWIKNYETSATGCH